MTTILETGAEGLVVKVDGPGNTVLSAMRNRAAELMTGWKQQRQALPVGPLRAVLVDTEHLGGDTYRATYREAQA